MTTRARARALTVRSAALAAVALTGVLAGCAADGADTSTTVTGTDDACELATTELPAGPISFEFTNDGTEVSELYVLRENDDIVGEVENVGPGTSRTLTVDLVAGVMSPRLDRPRAGARADRDPQRRRRMAAARRDRRDLPARAEGVPRLLAR